MKKVILLLILVLNIIIFNICANETYATDLLLQKDSSPSLVAGPPGSWDSAGRLMPTVIFDEGIYKMWYAGSDGVTSKIGYATSDDGKNWEIFVNNPVMSPQLPTETQFSETSVIRDGDQYKMWVTVVHNDGKLTIDYATSDDGKNWVKQLSPVLEGDEWESNQAVAGPSVIKIDDTYHMFYNGNDGVWKVGYATSSDGIIWNKHPTPVISATDAWEGSDVGRPSVTYNDNLFEIFYHAGNPPTAIGYAVSQDGLNWEKSDSNPLLTTGPNSFDSILIISPNSYVSNNIVKMWYSGFDGEKWSIGLAKSGEEETQLNPIVIIPSTFASWNKDALFKNIDVPQDAWKMSPLATYYDGLISTLKNAGYSDSVDSPQQNLFIFNYDWRQRVDDIAFELNDFITTKVKSKYPNSKIYLIGHSLGGLVGRDYLQTYGSDSIEQLVTLGTPHSGVIQTYKAWEGGTLESANLWEHIGLQMFLGVHRNDFRTNKDLVRELIPSIHDMLPTFDFLRKESDDSVILTSSLKHQNTWLNDLETDFSDYFNVFHSMYGVKNETPEWYAVHEPDFLDKLLGLWEDGKPTDTLFGSLGDQVVLSKSATRSADFATLLTDMNHTEIVTKTDALTPLMSILGLEPSEIVEGTQPDLSLPALVVLLLSPAEATISGPSGIFTTGEDEFVIIPEALSGNYQIQVKGTDTGTYRLLVGHIGDDTSSWDELIDNTVKDEIDSYLFHFDSANDLDSYVVDTDGSVNLKNAINEINYLKSQHPHWTLDLTLNSLKLADLHLKKKQNLLARTQVQNALLYLSSYRKKEVSIEGQNTAYLIMLNLENVYGVTQSPLTKISNLKLQADLTETGLLKNASELKLKKKGNEKKAQAFIFAANQLDQANQHYEEGQFSLSEAEVLIAKLLFAEI